MTNITYNAKAFERLQESKKATADVNAALAAHHAALDRADLILYAIAGLIVVLGAFAGAMLP